MSFLLLDRMGDIVAIDSAKSSKTKVNLTDKWTGVVYRLTDKRLTIAFEDDLDQFEDRCNLLKLSNEITFQRLKKAILKMKDLADKGTSADLLSTLFDPSKMPFYQTLGKPVEWLDKDLNASQRSAVEFALSAQQVALIHGPPGTGKTQTCIEVIQQLVKRGERVLVCGPSNLSVDNLVERLAKSKIPMVRIGHPARILDSVLQHSLEVRASSSDEGQIANDVRREMDMILKDMSKCRNRAERRQKWNDLKSLRKELKNREVKVVEDILNSAKIVLCTLNGAAGNKVFELVKRQGPFDTVLIDEAAQALEIECWIAILQAKKFILAGDHLQLPVSFIKDIDTL
jgi:DNA polymerase alpha-associated DNA helicase A